MLSRIMRSPLISTTMFLAVLGGIYLCKKALESGEPVSTAGQIYAYCFLVPLFVLWVLLVSIHNRKNPKDRISIWLGLSEVREVDEGQQWVTFKACRNVYIYYSICLPLAAFVVLFIPSDYVNALITFGLLGLGQYLVYGLTRWKYSRV